MATAVAPQPSVGSGQLTLQAPDGAEFEFEEVKTNRGQRSLGNVPILCWRDLDKAVAFYGEQGVINSLDGTSLRVSFQGIARRMRIAGKSDDEIAKSQIDFRPGARQGGVSTPVSKAASAARRAANKYSGTGIAEFLEKLARGEISEEVFAQAGITLGPPDAVEETDEPDEDDEAQQ
jgi:hypothetical protein